MERRGSIKGSQGVPAKNEKNRWKNAEGIEKVRQMRSVRWQINMEHSDTCLGGLTLIYEAVLRWLWLWKCYFLKNFSHKLVKNFFTRKPNITYFRNWNWYVAFCRLHSWNQVEV